MKKILLSLFIFTSIHGIAQIPEDAIRYSWFPNNGTARNRAIGGAMGSLGGDLTAAYVNPAGLGFYKTGEVVVTPGFLINNNTADFRQAQTVGKSNAFSFGTSGIILGFPSQLNSKKSNAFSFAVNQSANFNNTIHYKSLNNYSSFSEQFAEEFSKSGQSIENVLYSNSSYPYTAAPALYTYLIDTIRVNETVQVRGAPENTGCRPVHSAGDDQKNGWRYL